MRKVSVMVILIIVLLSSVSACGWFEDNRTGNRLFYDATDNLILIEDKDLLMDRFPTPMEKSMNSVIEGQGSINYVDNPSIIFYNEQSKIVGIHDEVLLMTRFPNKIEIEKNIYVLQSVQ